MLSKQLYRYLNLKACILFCPRLKIISSFLCFIKRKHLKKLWKMLLLHLKSSFFSWDINFSVFFFWFSFCNFQIQRFRWNWDTNTHKHTHTLTGKQNFTLVYQKLRSYVYLHSYGLNKQTGYFGPIFALYLWPIFPFYKIF